MKQISTLEVPEKIKGLLLHFDQGLFNLAYSASNEVIPFVKNLMEAYLMLDLKKPFDSALLISFLNADGATQAVNEFKESVRSDMSIFKNPISKNETEHKIEEYSNKIYEPLRKLKQAIANFNSNHTYKLKAADFEITGKSVELNTDDLQDHCSEKLTSDTQIEAYKKLHALALAYNELMEFTDNHGVKVSHANDVFNLFFSRVVINNSDWTPYGNKIEIFKKNLSVFK